MFLLDANVVSELRRVKPHGGVLGWLRAVDNSEIFVPAVVLAELQAGIERARIQNAEKAAEIEAWLDEMAMSFNVLLMSAVMFRVWAKMLVGRADEIYEDAMIAAMAIVLGFTIVTRNVRDFDGFGVKLIDPFVAKR